MYTLYYVYLPGTIVQLVGPQVEHLLDNQDLLQVDNPLVVEDIHLVVEDNLLVQLLGNQLGELLLLDSQLVAPLLLGIHLEHLALLDIHQGEPRKLLGNRLLDILTWLVVSEKIKR